MIALYLFQTCIGLILVYLLFHLPESIWSPTWLFLCSSQYVFRSLGSFLVLETMQTYYLFFCHLLSILESSGSFLGVIRCSNLKDPLHFPVELVHFSNYVLAEAVNYTPLPGLILSPLEKHACTNTTTSRIAVQAQTGPWPVFHLHSCK